MDRKKTILIAVMINAGLLAALFVVALTSQDEVIPAIEIAQTPVKLEKPLFPDSADLALQSPQAHTIAPPPSIQIPVNESALENSSKEQLVHHLPPLAVEEIAVAPPTPSSDPSFFKIVVKKGDSLDKLAREHQTTVDEIIKINQLPSSFLRIGQVLKISSAKMAGPAIKPKIQEKVSGPEYYTVKVGDNPWTIAMKHHMKVEELLKLNHLNEKNARKLKPGDRLRIR